MRLKVGIALLLPAISVVSLWWLYAPEHLLVRITDLATVTVNGHSVQAETYMAHPTHYESDAILLVIVPGEGNYLFNFDEEKFLILSQGFVRLHWCVVDLRRVSEGNWLEPLPFRNINEFRIISAAGHAVTVKF